MTHSAVEESRTLATQRATRLVVRRAAGLFAPADFGALTAIAPALRSCDADRRWVLRSQSHLSQKCLSINRSQPPFQLISRNQEFGDRTEKSTDRCTENTADKEEAEAELQEC
jgi:hypothetical protein